MTDNLPVLPNQHVWPPAIAHASQEAWIAILQFFAAEIDNANTRRSYIRGAEDFFTFAAAKPGGERLETITSLHIAAWIEHLKRRGVSTPTVKQRLAGIKRLFQALARERIIPFNTAGLVRGPKYSVTKGKTPVLTGEEILKLLNSIDTETLIGLRDRALIGAMAYSFARIGAVSALRVSDIFRQHRRLWLRLSEKGGKIVDVPCHHHFENYLMEWLERGGHGKTPAAPLFQTFTWDNLEGRRVLSGRSMSQSMAWEMVQRRAKAAGIDTAVCNHTFRAAGITAYLANGGTIENAARIAAHASTRTTQLYDRRPDDITLDEIEKIRFG